MADHIVLRIPAGLSTVDETAPLIEWLTVDGLGQALGPVRHGRLDEIPPGQARLTVLAPGTEVADALVAVPGRNASKLAKLVPFALEEQLASDVDEMHFALGGRAPDGRLAVVAVDRRRLAGWLSALASCGLHPQAMFADTALLPDNPAHIVVMIDGDRVMVRRPTATPVTLDATPIDLALELAGVFTPGDDRTLGDELHLLIYASPVDWERHQVALERIRTRVTTLKGQILPDGVLPLLASAAVRGAGVNLLQGEFLPRATVGDGWSRYRMAAMFGALFLVLHLGALGVARWQWHREESTLDAALLAAGREALPEVHNLSRLPSVRLAVEGRMNQLRAASATGVVGSLAAVAAPFAGSDAIVQSVNYQPGNMQLTVDVPNSGFLEQLRQSAASHGFKVEIESTVPHEARVQGRVRVLESGI